MTHFKNSILEVELQRGWQSQPLTVHDSIKKLRESYWERPTAVIIYYKNL